MFTPELAVFASSIKEGRIVITEVNKLIDHLRRWWERNEKNRGFKCLLSSN